MDTKKAMSDLVSGFVNDLLGLIRHLLDEEVTAALRTLPVPTVTQPVQGPPQVEQTDLSSSTHSSPVTTSKGW